MQPGTLIKPATFFVILSLQPAQTSITYVADVQRVRCDAVSGPATSEYSVGPVMVPSTVAAIAPAPEITPDVSAESATLAELASYLELGDEWVSHGNILPAASEIAAAQRIISLLPAGLPIPKAMVSSSGNVGLYWNSAGAYADLVLESDGTLSLFTREKGTDFESFQTDFTTADVTRDWLDQRLSPIKDLLRPS